MEVILLGVRYLDFPDPDSGSLIQGYQLHFAYHDNTVNGFLSAKKFIRLNHSLVQQVQALWSNKQQKFPVPAIFHYGPKDSLIGIDIK